MPARIVDSIEAYAMLWNWLEDPQTLFIGANVAYDFAVVAQAYPDLRPAIFAAYEEDRVTDVQIRQRLLDIANDCYEGYYDRSGVYHKLRYSLEALAARLCAMVLQKDAWRLSYGNFIRTPLLQWPVKAVEVQAAARPLLAALEAKWSGQPPPKEVKDRIEGLRSMIASDPSRCTEYPLDDARATLAVWQKQEAHASYLADQYRQARAAFALHLGSCWGIRTDAPGVEILEREVREEYEEVKIKMLESGLLREDGTRDMKRAKRLMLDACAREGVRVRRTDGHREGKCCKRLDGTILPLGSEECEDHVCLDDDACKAVGDAELGGPLATYARFSTLTKVLSNDVNLLRKGIQYPIHPRYGLAETGRTTCSPNIQNLRRDKPKKPKKEGDT